MKTKQDVLEGKESIFDIQCLVSEIMRVCFRKEKIWEYEQEYRILTKNYYAIAAEEYEQYLSENGSLHKYEEVGLRLKSVILGLNCNEDDEKLIADIVKDINEKRLLEAIGNDRIYEQERMQKVMEDLGEFVVVKRIYVNEEDLTLVVK